MTTYPTPTVPAAYAGALQAFTTLVVELESDTNRAADHAAIERRIDQKGKEILRQMFEAWLALRASNAPRRNVVGRDDVARTHHRTAARALESLFGEVSIQRDQVTARGHESLVPVDALLNLAEDRFTFGVRERVVEEAIRGSYDDAVEAVRETTGASVAKRQAEELVIAAAVDFDAFYEETVAPAPPNVSDLLVLTADGKGIVMRPEGLREATRRAAASGTHKLEKRLSKGEKKNRKRMAEVSAVYDLPAVPRTADDVLGNLDGAAPSPRPRPQNKRVWASVEKPLCTVIAEAFAEADQRDPDHRRRWVALVDGNKTQIKEINREAERRGVEVTLVLDIIHVIEYLWTAAWDVFKEGDAAAEKWVRKYLVQILHGRAPIVAAAIRRLATFRALGKRTGIDSCAAYLLKYKSMLRYDEYLAGGLPIATGVIEGACRHLVKDRMDITGARWGLPGAEAILRLRSLKVSGDLPAYWAFHQQREFVRNHVSSYAASEEAWLWKEAA
jgi:hypothetical protein